MISLVMPRRLRSVSATEIMTSLPLFAGVISTDTTRTFSFCMIRSENSGCAGFYQGMVGAMHRLGHACRYSEYAGHGHDAWEPAFEEPKLWDWLLRQSQGKRVRISP